MYKITTKDGTFEAPTADEAIKMALDYSRKAIKDYPLEPDKGRWPPRMPPLAWYKVTCEVPR